jgi:uncharacterized protein YutE (UPF0331/DUF86 family)
MDTSSQLTRHSKAFKEIAEASMDVIAMLCKDVNLGTRTITKNIEGLSLIDRKTEIFLAAAIQLKKSPCVPLQSDN